MIWSYEVTLRSMKSCCEARGFDASGKNKNLLEQLFGKIKGGIYVQLFCNFTLLLSKREMWSKIKQKLDTEYILWTPEN